MYRETVPSLLESLCPKCFVVSEMRTSFQADRKILRTCGSVVCLGHGGYGCFGVHFRNPQRFLTMPNVKALVSVGEIERAEVWLTSFDNGESTITLKTTPHGGNALFLTNDEARELADHLITAADQLGDGTLTISVTPPRHS